MPSRYPTTLVVFNLWGGPTESVIVLAFHAR